jgi:hypothetical protein
VQKHVFVFFIKFLDLFGKAGAGVFVVLVLVLELLIEHAKRRQKVPVGLIIPNRRAGGVKQEGGANVTAGTLGLLDLRHGHHLLLLEQDVFRAEERSLSVPHARHKGLART